MKTRLLSIFLSFVLALGCALPSAAQNAQTAPGQPARIEVMDMDDVARVRSGGLVSQTKNARFGFKHSALWQPDIYYYATYNLPEAQDWSDYEAIVFTVHSNMASNKDFQFRYISDEIIVPNAMRINWQGWASVIVPLTGNVRGNVTNLRFQQSNIHDGIVGQELTFASIRLIDKDIYSEYDALFGYEASDLTQAVLPHGIAVCDGSKYAFVYGEKLPLGDADERAFLKNGNVMVPKAFLTSLKMNVKELESISIDGTEYVSFNRAASASGLNLAVSGGFAIAGEEDVMIFDSVNKLNPYSACATELLREEESDLSGVTAEGFSLIGKRAADSLKAAATGDITAVNDNAKKQLLSLSRYSSNPFGDLKFDSPADISEAYSRIEQLSLACAAEESQYYGDKQAASLAADALEYIYTEYFGEKPVFKASSFEKDSEEYYHLNTAAPLHLANSLLLLGDAVSAEKVQKYTEVFSDIHFIDNEDKAPESASAIIKLAALRHDTDKIYYAGQKISERFMYADDERVQNEEPFLVNEPYYHIPLKERRIEELTQYQRGGIARLLGQGIYSDGSYISGGAHAANGSDGLRLLELIESASLLADTPFEPDESSRQRMFLTLANGFYPFVYNGNMMRTVTRNENNNLSAKGTGVLKALLDFSTLADEADIPLLNAMIADLSAQFEKTALTPHQSEALESALSGESAQITEKSRMYARMDRAVHRTEDFAASLAISSSRIFDYDSSECKNTTGWYMGQGMLNVSNKGDSLSFSDSYWSRVNPYRLPGTTVQMTERVSASIKNGREYQKGSAFAGGASNGAFTAAAMIQAPYIVENAEGIGEKGSEHFEGVEHNIAVNLSAKKAYFMLDDEVVVLGSDITSADDKPVVTTVDNRQGAYDLSEGKSADAKTSWMHLGGDSDYGYYFPQKAFVTAQKGENGFTEITLNHGIRPIKASFAYVMLPGRSKSETAAYAQNPDIRILRNNDMIQAVTDSTLGIGCYVFYGSAVCADLEVSDPMIIMTEKTSEGMKLYVSDPTHKLGEAKITVNGAWSAGEPYVTSEVKSAKTELTVDFTDSCGKTLVIELK